MVGQGPTCIGDQLQHVDMGKSTKVCLTGAGGEQWGGRIWGRGVLPATVLKSSFLKHRRDHLVSVLGTELERKVWTELAGASEGCALGWWPGVLGILWCVAV